MTPLQMATMCARIATGYDIKPKLLKKYEDIETQSTPVHEGYLTLIRQGMFEVVNGRHGTAKGARRKGVSIAGKTGTVQVVSERIEEHVDMEDVPLKKRPHGMFIGYAPFDDPKYAVAVVVENGGSGSGAAAPVAANVLQKATEVLG